MVTLTDNAIKAVNHFIIGSEGGAEVLSDSSDVPPVASERPETPNKEQESPFYIVPPPPIPGKTAWSVVPW